MTCCYSNVYKKKNKKKTSGCSRDSVHIQSTKYEAGSNYYAEQRCLNTEWRAGRFRRFSCTGSAALLENFDASAADDIDTDALVEAEDGLSSGSIVVIVFAVILCICLIGVFVAYFLVRRRRDDVTVCDGGGDVAVDNEYFDDVPPQGESYADSIALGGDGDDGDCSAYSDDVPPQGESYAEATSYATKDEPSFI